MATVMVFVPLQEEMEYIYNFMIANGGIVGRPYSQSTSSYTFNWPLPRLVSRRVTHLDISFSVIGDMGNLRAATKMAPILSKHPVPLVFLVGVAGSLNREFVNVGDVVFANRAKMLHADKIKKISGTKERFEAPAIGWSGPVWTVDDRKRFLKSSFFRFRRDYADWPASDFHVDYYASHVRSNPLNGLESVTCSKIQGLLPKYENLSPSVKLSDILGSEVVIDSDEYVEFVVDKDTSIANEYYAKDPTGALRQKWFVSPLNVVDMESFGFFKMLESMRDCATCAFSVRGISDLASEKLELDELTKDAVRGVAVRNAFKVVLDMINFLGPQIIGL